MARRAGLWALGGASAATGVLVASPEAYVWLRRRLGLETADVAGEPVEFDDEEGSFDTREARLSLRARLNESEPDTAIVPSDEAAADERPLAARPRPAREDVEPMRRAVDEARARMLDTARDAARKNGPTA